MTRPQDAAPRAGVSKLGNEYLREYRGTYDRIPKAVLGAIALSFASRIVEREPWDALVLSILFDEWRALHANGIVPQAPPKGLLRREGGAS